MSQPHHKWLFFIPVLLGIAVFITLKKSNPGAEQSIIEERATAVRVISPPVMEVMPQVVAFGNVVPGKVLRSIAEVAGELVYVHPRLSDGELVRTGEVLLRIDPVDFELAVAQSQAQVSAAHIRLAEFDTTEKSNRSLLALDQEALKVSESELKRLQDLQKKGAVARSDVDSQTQSTLSRRQSVQSRKNVLADLPGQRGLQEAELARYQAQLQQAQRNLARTEIKAPFDGRIAATTLEQGQYVRAGDSLFELDAIDRAEVSVQLPMQHMAALVHGSADSATSNDETPQPDQLISAQVMLELGEQKLVWPAEVIRLSDQIDAKTRTVGLIVSVNDPYKNVQAGRRPPLVKGMFVKVLLQAKQAQTLPVVPRNALDNGQLKIVDQDRRLRFLAVHTEVSADDYAAFTIPDNTTTVDNLRVVISDLVPAIDQMLLNPVDDPESLSALQAAVRGEVTP